MAVFFFFYSTDTIPPQFLVPGTEFMLLSLVMEIHRRSVGYTYCGLSNACWVFPMYILGHDCRQNSFKPLSGFRMLFMDHIAKRSVEDKRGC